MRNITIKIIKISTLTLFVIVLILQGCSQNKKKPLSGAVWKQQLENQLPLLGHRNWILIVDKAFPLQAIDGLSMVYAEDELLDVLEYTLGRIEKNNHIKPVLYTDKELDFLNQDLVPGIDSYKSSLKKVIGKSNVQVLLHDSVFVKIDEASKLFKTLVIKTNQVIPYSSVFIELDCDYWSMEKETQLRKLMQTSRHD
jgi:D-ribose pyranose/furanose isomerase RbsD